MAANIGRVFTFAASNLSRCSLSRVVSVSKFSPIIFSRFCSSTSEVRPGLKYSEDHEWLSIADKVATVGITHHAQEQLGEVVYCELPEVGTELEKAEACGAIESVKACSDVLAPVSGEVVEINDRIVDDPNLINSQPYDAGWLFKLKIKDEADLAELMDADGYNKLLGEDES